MVRFVLTLTGLALLSQAHHATAQTGSVKNIGLDQFFSSVYRSSPSLSDFSGVCDNRGGNANSGFNINSLKTVPADLSRKYLSHNDLLRASCEKIMKEDNRITSLIDMKIDRVMRRSGKMKLQLRGIYTQGSALYFLLRMQNRSSLDYDVEAIHFFIADASKRKTPSVRSPLVQSSPVQDPSVQTPSIQSSSVQSSAVQSSPVQSPFVQNLLVQSLLVQYTELKPVYIYDSSSVVRGYGQATNVVVLPRFTVPLGKRLVIEVLEKNGGRQLQLETSNFMLERARIL